MKMTVKRHDVRPGDVLLDCLGEPYFRVTRIDSARKRGYLVFSGENLKFRGGAQTEGGYYRYSVVIERS